MRQKMTRPNQFGGASEFRRRESKRRDRARQWRLAERSTPAMLLAVRRRGGRSGSGRLKLRRGDFWTLFSWQRSNGIVVGGGRKIGIGVAASMHLFFEPAHSLLELGRPLAQPP